MPPGRKRRLIREGGSAAWISNELRPPDYGGAPLTTARTKTSIWTVPPADTHNRGGISYKHVCFPLAQGPVEQLVPRLACCRLTRQMDRKLEVKASVVMIDVIPEPVDIPVPTGLAIAKNGTNNTPPLVHQVVSKDDLSADEEVVADSKFRDTVVGGPTPTTLKIAGLIIDLAGHVTVAVSSSADLAGDVTASVASSTDLAGDVTASVSTPSDLAGDLEAFSASSSADHAGDVTVGVSPSVWRPRLILLEILPSV